MYIGLLKITENGCGDSCRVATSVGSEALCKKFFMSGSNVFKTVRKLLIISHVRTNRQKAQQQTTELERQTYFCSPALKRVTKCVHYADITEKRYCDIDASSASQRSLP